MDEISRIPASKETLTVRSVFVKSWLVCEAWKVPECEDLFVEVKEVLVWNWAGEN